MKICWENRQNEYLSTGRILEFDSGAKFSEVTPAKLTCHILWFSSEIFHFEIKKKYWIYICFFLLLKNQTKDIYECKTCGLTGSLCCCSECARTCHAGHDCVLKKTSPTAYCDCLEKCPCRSQVNGNQDMRMELFVLLLNHTKLSQLSTDKGTVLQNKRYRKSSPWKHLLTLVFVYKDETAKPHVIFKILIIMPKR